jgi:soluble lytic murein transglycosylase-like protein
VAALRGALAAIILVAAAPAAANPVDRWSSHIAEASERFGIPAAWIRQVIRAESDGETMLHGRPIISSAGAMGLMQLMPATWSEMRLAVGLGLDPHDPRDNILAGTAYLRLMYDRFGYPGLFAAYNAGPGRYAATLSGQRRLPLETRRYVANVAGSRGPRSRSAGPSLFALSTGNHPAPGLAAPRPAARKDGLFVPLSGAAAR